MWLSGACNSLLQAILLPADCGAGQSGNCRYRWNLVEQKYGVRRRAQRGTILREGQAPREERSRSVWTRGRHCGVPQRHWRLKFSQRHLSLGSWKHRRDGLAPRNERFRAGSSSTLGPREQLDLDRVQSLVLGQDPGSDPAHNPARDPCPDAQGK